MRTFLCAYFCRRFDHPFTLAPERYGDARIPPVVYSHDLFEQRTKADAWDRLRGKYLVPLQALRRARIVLLVRDPRDAFTSFFVQLTHRTRETRQEIKRKNISELLRDPAFGIRSMVEVMNGWRAEFAQNPHFSLARYESLRAEPAPHFRALLHSLGEEALDATALAQALAFSEFANMKKLEREGAFDSKILRAGDPREPESFKVRRGLVGGYRDYLVGDDLVYAARAVRELDAAFGYAP